MGVGSMNDLLNKFDTIEVNNNTRISAEDQAFCEDQEQQFKEFLSFADDYIFYLNYNPLSNKFYNSEYLVNEMNKTKENKKDQFISNIVDYFRDKYRVTLKDEPLRKKYNIDVTYNIIIDEIIEQLGGFNFSDKAAQEIKERLKNKIRGYNRNHVNVKKSKVILDDFFYVDQWDKKWGNDYGISYNYRQEFHHLFIAISHFEQGTTNNTYQGIMHTIDYEKGDKVFTTHSMMCIKAESIKLFKNGKVEILFLTPEYAQQFAKEYCGYLPEQKTA
jgi:hypothetical protein